MPPRSSRISGAGAGVGDCARLSGYIRMSRRNGWRMSLGRKRSHTSPVDGCRRTASSRPEGPSSPRYRSGILGTSALSTLLPNRSTRRAGASPPIFRSLNNHLLPGPLVATASSATPYFLSSRTALAHWPAHVSRRDYLRPVQRFPQGSLCRRFAHGSRHSPCVPIRVGVWRDCNHSVTIETLIFESVAGRRRALPLVAPVTGEIAIPKEPN